MQKLKVVCFGGGTGLSALLSGLKNKNEVDITAVVTMFDAGGSSGVLRDRFGILPPGDIARCIMSLAPDSLQSAISEIFRQRLADGHTPGNAYLYAMEMLYVDYQTAIDEFCRTFKAMGKVLPVSLTKGSNLCALFDGGMQANTEPEVDAQVRRGGIVKLLNLWPPVHVNRLVLEAIGGADIICIGPGSFYTSILPNFLPEGIAEAIQEADAPVIYIANLMTEGLGMQKWTLSTYVNELSGVLNRFLNKVVTNDELPARSRLERYADEQRYPVVADYATNDPRIIRAALWETGEFVRHDPQKLADAIMKAIVDVLKQTP